MYDGDSLAQAHQKKKTAMAGGESHGGILMGGQRPRWGGRPLSSLAAAGDGPKTRQRRDQSPMDNRWLPKCGISREFGQAKHYKYVTLLHVASAALPFCKCRMPQRIPLRHRCRNSVKDQFGKGWSRTTFTKLVLSPAMPKSLSVARSRVFGLRRATPSIFVGISL